MAAKAHVGFPPHSGAHSSRGLLMRSLESKNIDGAGSEDKTPKRKPARAVLQQGADALFRLFTPYSQSHT